MYNSTTTAVSLAEVESSVDTPDNQIAVVGRQMTLHCSAYSKESQITWKFRKHGELAERLIAEGVNVSSSFRKFLINHTSDGQFSLINRNPQLKDAGTYKCVQTMGSQQTMLRTYTSVLTVLGEFCN